jgi:hypothetical protein
VSNVPEKMAMLGSAMCFVSTAAGNTSRVSEMLAWATAFIWAYTAYRLQETK